MKKIFLYQFLLIASGIFFLLLCSFIKRPLIQGCGTERWDVKTLQDTASARINWTPIQSDVKSLINFIQTVEAKRKRGSVVPDTENKKRLGLEFNVYTIKCKVREYKKEDDGDYHLVLMDLSDTTKTMVGEILNPKCEELKNSKYLSAFQNVREDFESYIIPNKKIQSGIYELTGVCFFDFPHGQLGVAPNAVELHPIMNLIQYSRYAK